MRQRFQTEVEGHEVITINYMGMIVTKITPGFHGSSMTMRKRSPKAEAIDNFHLRMCQRVRDEENLNRILQAEKQGLLNHKAAKI